MTEQLTAQQQIQILNELGITRYQISRETGISQASLCRWASGTNVPRKCNKNVDILNEYFQGIIRDNNFRWV